MIFIHVEAETTDKRIRASFLHDPVESVQDGQVLEFYLSLLFLREHTLTTLRLAVPASQYDV